MKKIVRNALALPAAASTALLVPAVAFAQNSSAAETGVTQGYEKVTAVINVAIPLMFVVAGTIAAAMWGLKLLRR